MAWGNNGNIPYPQDMISDQEEKNILKVNDVNDGNDAKIAGHFVNSSNNANARALKVQGKSEFVGEVAVVLERDRSVAPTGKALF